VIGEEEDWAGGIERLEVEGAEAEETAEQQTQDSFHDRGSCGVKSDAAHQ
jgi:hypothetical protein